MRSAENSYVIHEETTATGENSNLVSRVQSKIIDLIVFERNVDTTANLYVFVQFVKPTQVYFQQDCSTFRTSREFLAMIQNFVEDGVISKDMWPPRWLEFNPRNPSVRRSLP
jgi:hypothetical protein